MGEDVKCLKLRKIVQQQIESELALEQAELVVHSN